MLLHHYISSTHALKTLTDKAFFAANPTTFNDPFELCFRLEANYTKQDARKEYLVRVQQPHIRAAIEAHRGKPFKSAKAYLREMKNRKEEMTEKYAAGVNKLTYENFKTSVEDNARHHLRVVCFCDADKIASGDDILMWAHYADKHRGIRLTVRPTPGVYPFSIDPIKYEVERVVQDLKWAVDDPRTVAAVKATITTKSKAWQYEHEVRFVIEPKHCSTRTDEPDKHYIPFPPEWVLSVDVGLRIEPQLASDIRKVVAEQFPKASFRRAHMHKTDYSINYVAEA